MYLSPVEQRTYHFYEWEQRGRGWFLWDGPVDIEPPFIPFDATRARKTAQVDDGRMHTLTSFVLSKLGSLFSSTPKNDSPPFDFQENPVGIELPANPEPLWEVKFLLPPNKAANAELVKQFLLMVSGTGALSFEIIGFPAMTITRLVCKQSEVQWVYNQLLAYFPEAQVAISRDMMDILWFSELDTAIVDFGLSEECMRPLYRAKSFEPDPLTGIIAALDQLGLNEWGMLQVIFKQTKYPWSKHLVRSVSNGKGGSFFSDAPDMYKLALEKTSSPLFSAVIRVAAQAESVPRTRSVIEGLIHAVQSSTASHSNSLIPLSNEGYDLEYHARCVDRRITHRSGMLLNIAELATLIHPPSPSIVSQKLRGSVKKSKLAPQSVREHRCVIGTNVHFGEQVEVSLSTEQRLRHLHITGKTGTGKTTLLKRMMISDMQSGGGIMVLDPHGDLIDDLLPHVPESRMEDVVVIDPADLEYPVGFNLLSAHSEMEKIILSSDLVALFRRFSTSWGDQMHSVLANAILAFLEHPNGGSMVDLRRFLVEPAFRSRFLANITDPSVNYYWKQEFPMIRKGVISPIVTRLDTFLRTKLIRNMMAQRKGIDLGQLVQKRKIILVKLAQGLIGKENSYLLGTLFVAKLNQVAQARQVQHKENRAPFYLYIDEAHNFFTPSMEEILSGARKFGLGLVLAHQSLSQLKADPIVGDALIANAGTRVCFRMGDDDAKKLAQGFSYFDAEDLQGLSIGEAIVRVGQASHDFNMVTQQIEPVPDSDAASRRNAIRTYSRNTYAQKREEVEKGMYQVQVKKSKEPAVQDFVDEPKGAISPGDAQNMAEEKPQTEVKESLHKEPLPVSAIVPPNVQQETDPVQETEQRQHRYLQTLFKKIAEERGFKAVLEEPTENEKGRVDVGLEQNGKRYAIEISVTTNPEHELGNIQKCLASGYTMVLVTSPRPKHLNNIKVLAQERLSPDSLQKVQFLSPDEITQYLNTVAASELGSEKRVKGYRVKVNYQAVSQNQQQQRQEAISKVIVDALRRNKG